MKKLIICCLTAQVLTFIVLAVAKREGGFRFIDGMIFFLLLFVVACKIYDFKKPDTE